MSPALAPALACLLAVSLSALATSGWIRFARSRRIVDVPGHRRLHAAPTPRGGGLGIALVLLAAVFAIGARQGQGVDSAMPAIAWHGVAAGLALFAGVGLWDDLRPLPAAAKLFLQLIAAAVLVSALASPVSVPMALWVALVLVAAFVANAWNFMDGSNGLVASQALLLALLLAFWPGQVSEVRFLALALFSGCLGFLPFNFPVARVFLGDIGSHVLGAASFCLLCLDWLAGVLSLPQVLLLASAFLLDTLLTLGRRAWSGRTVWQAHREHLYQYGIRKGHSPAMVCLAYGVWTTMAGALALLSGPRPAYAWASLVACFLVGVGVNASLRSRWLRRMERRK